MQTKRKRLLFITLFCFRNWDFIRQSNIKTLTLKSENFPKLATLYPFGMAAKIDIFFDLINFLLQNIESKNKTPFFPNKNITFAGTIRNGMTEKLNIKNWAEEDRPREKMMLKGTQSLSDAELIAILIGSGNQDETAVELSRRILKSVDNNLNDLGKLSISELIKNFKGIGEAKAITIAAALELGRRRKSEKAQTRNQIYSSKHIFEIFAPILADLPHEEFWALFLNRSNTVIYKSKISQGGVDNAPIDIKILLKTAIEKLATGIAVCHNHPSENTTPSKRDMNITQKIKTACQTMEINFLDHIIVGGKNYYSFADENRL